MWLVWRVFVTAAILCTCGASLSSAAVPNDTYYSQYQWYSNTIGMPNAWDISTGSPSVKVAVLDTGVISNTPDLAGRILSPLSAVPGQDPFADEWMTVTSPSIRRHGTWVASAIAMGVNNGMGGAGIGNFSILPIRITDEDVYTQDDWLYQGIIMAADQGAKVINISYSASDYGLLDSAAAYARAHGALTFIGAGNSNSFRDISDYTNLIFVGGTDQYDQRWSSSSTVGSSWGKFMDLVAPASNIVVANPTTDNLNGYGLISGTSFSTALASGAAALVWSINPNLTPDEVEQLMRSTAVDLGDQGWDQIYGWGQINVNALAQD